MRKLKPTKSQRSGQDDEKVGFSCYLLSPIFRGQSVREEFCSDNAVSQGNISSVLSSQPCPWEQF